MTRAATWLLGVSTLIVMGACASSGAASSPLSVPLPPPRIVETTDPPPDVVASDPPARPAPQRPPQVSGATVTPPATSTPAPTPAPAPAPTPPPVPASAPAELRQAGPTASSVDVREIIDRATRKLDAQDPKKLGAGGQLDYDTARRILAQAEAALKENNLVFARSLAEKSETLANGLR